MSIKQRLKKIEQHPASKARKFHVIIVNPDETEEEAYSKYAEHNKINLDDDTVIVVKFADGAKHDR